MAIERQHDRFASNIDEPTKIITKWSIDQAYSLQFLCQLLEIRIHPREFF